MKKRIKIIVILSCVFVLSLAALVLSSCSLKKRSLEDITKDGYVHTVTYDFQNGNTAVIRLAEGLPAPKPGVSSKAISTPTRRDKDNIGYTLLGYYDGTVEEDGTLTYGEEWNFATPISGDVTIYAKWRKNYAVYLHYFEDDKDGKPVEQIKAIEVAEKEDGTPTDVSKTSLAVSSQLTALDYYYEYSDGQYKDKVDFVKDNFTPGQLSHENGVTVVDVWADCLKGSWKIIDSESDFKSINYNTNVYLRCDLDMNKIYDPDGKIEDWDVKYWNETEWVHNFGKDYEQLTDRASAIQSAIAKFSFPDSYDGKFYGNGHTIKNFKSNLVQALGKSDKNFGIFKSLSDTAEIKDVEFENVEIYVKITNTNINDYRIGLFAGKTTEKTVIDNVKLTGKLVCDIAEKAGFTENLNVYPFTDQSDEESCTPVNCDYTDVKVTKNGNEVDWKNQQADNAE